MAAQTQVTLASTSDTPGHVFIPGRNTVPAPQVQADPSSFYIMAQNFAGILECESDNAYAPMCEYLSKCPISYALTATPEKHYPEMLYEFWYTCTFNKSAGFINGTIKNGRKRILFNLASLRDILHLPYYDQYEAPATVDEIVCMLRQMGYNFPLSEDGTEITKGKIVRSRMQPLWVFFFAHVIQCLTGRPRSLDQANHNDLKVAHALFTGRKIDFAKFIFDDLVKRISKNDRDTGVPYTRFISLVFLHELGPR